MKILVMLSLATGMVLVAQQTQLPDLTGIPFPAAQAITGGAVVRARPSPQWEFGAPVTGSPYSAEAITETTQTLPDGNRIVQRTSAMRYRDGKGRERREISTPAVAGAGRPVVFISDPAAGVIWTLNPLNNTAQKEAMTAAKPSTPPPAHGGAIGVMVPEDDHGFVKARGFDHGALIGGTAHGSAAEQAGLLNEDIILAIDGQPVKNNSDLMARISAAPVGVQLALDVDRAGTSLRVHLATRDRSQVFQGATAWISALPAAPQFQALLNNGLLPPTPDQSTVDDLGTRNIGGVKAQGARITTTIPAGEAGNERPIQLVNEAWYSPDLQTTVMTKRNDPRTGEIVFRLDGINRTEPEPSLFELPADYKIAPAVVPAFVPRKEE